DRAHHTPRPAVGSRLGAPLDLDPAIFGAGVDILFVDATAMIPHDREHLLRRILAHSPDKEVARHRRVAAVGFTELADDIRSQRRAFSQMVAIGLAVSPSIEL